jgi:DNA-binding beta-propeller fold protein YncE
MVMLMWTATPGAEGYRVLRKVGDGKFVEIFTGPGTVFQDKGIPSAGLVTYKVEAVVPGKAAEASPEAAIRIAEELKPPSMTGAVIDLDRITLRWSTPPGAAFFNLYRSVQGDRNYSLVSSLQSDTYVDRDVAKGKEYHYRVTAVDAANRESPKSDFVRAALRDDRGARVEEKPVVRKAKPKRTFRGEAGRELNQPGDVILLPQREIGVLERGGIQVFDPEGAFVRKVPFGEKWGLPAGATLDSDGNFLVAFYGRGVVRRIDPKGQLEMEIGYPPWRGPSIPPAAFDNAVPGKDAPGETGEFGRTYPRNNPNGVAVDANGHYWIADGVRGQVIKASYDGRFIKVLGKPPGDPDPRFRDEPDLAGARRIHFNPVDGKLYLVLGPRAEIAVIDPATAKVVRVFGGVGAGNAQFQGVGGVAFRKNGNVLVLDHLMRVVKEFSPDYRYVATWADVIERDRAYLSSNLATSMAWREETRTLYVTSAMGNRVYRFEFPE